MYHPLLLQPEVLRDLPALIDDLRPRTGELAAPSYRSEAFAEDLFGHEAPAEHPGARRPVVLLLTVAPLCVALAGGMLTLLA